MAYQRKLGRPADQRKALLRNQVTHLLWYGRIETTQARAKEVRSVAERLITSKLHARRLMMAYLYDLQEQKKDKESKSDYRERTKDVKHPLIEKLFGEIGPKYKKRNEEKSCAGGYTRIVRKGPRRGDAAEMVILELV
ncbi:MAG TPA: 50S ribosomal protein L17 [Clostridia bacterium]|nr:50S ribosomal protein L17 [Clostridia bacterium]